MISLIPQTMFYKKIKKGRGCFISRKAVFINGTVEFGDYCLVAPFAMFDPQHGHIEIGNHVSINAHTVIYGNVKIGDDSRVAAHVTIVGSDHNYMDKNKPIRKQGVSRAGVVVGRDVWIGSGARILDGSIIGDGCVIGANSVVKGTLEPYGVYVGAPAKKVKSRT